MPQDDQKLHGLKKTQYVQALCWKTETTMVELHFQILQRKTLITAKTADPVNYKNSSQFQLYK